MVVIGAIFHLHAVYQTACTLASVCFSGVLLFFVAEKDSLEHMLYQRKTICLSPFVEKNVSKKIKKGLHWSAELCIMRLHPVGVIDKAKLAQW